MKTVFTRNELWKSFHSHRIIEQWKLDYCRDLKRESGVDWSCISRDDEYVFLPGLKINRSTMAPMCIPSGDDNLLKEFWQAYLRARDPVTYIADLQSIASLSSLSLFEVMQVVARLWFASGNASDYVPVRILLYRDRHTDVIPFVEIHLKSEVERLSRVDYKRWMEFGLDEQSE